MGETTIASAAARVRKTASWRYPISYAGQLADLVLRGYSKPGVIECQREVFFHHQARGGQVHVNLWGAALIALRDNLDEVLAFSIAAEQQIRLTERRDTAFYDEIGRIFSLSPGTVSSIHRLQWEVGGPQVIRMLTSEKIDLHK